MIRAAVGLSTEENSAKAAIEAGRQVVEGLGGERADWCVVFATGEHREQLDALSSSLASVVGTPYIVGCSASGVIASGREVEQGAALGVLGVVSDQLQGTPFLFHDEGDRGMTAGIRLGQRLLASRGTDDVLLVWPDPYHVRPDRLLQSLDAMLDAVPVVGGAASTRDEHQPRFQFCGEESGEAAVSGIRLGGRFNHVVDVTQGCRPLGEALRVTRSHDNMILEIDGRSPLQVLTERAPRGMADDLDWALNFLFVGLLPQSNPRDVRSGEYLVRNIVSADPDTGVLSLADPVEEGQYIVFAEREGQAAREDLIRTLERVSPERTGLNYRFGLYFNCLARGRSLYEQEGVDSELLGRKFPGLPMLGFFCNAELAPLRGVNQLFTYTGVLLLVAD